MNEWCAREGQRTRAHKQGDVVSMRSSQSEPPNCRARLIMQHACDNTHIAKLRGSVRVLIDINNITVQKNERGNTYCSLSSSLKQLASRNV